MERPAELIESLRGVRHFREMGLEQLRAIVTSGQVRSFPAGSRILVEGDPVAGMFVLLRGRVHLAKIGPDGRAAIMSVIEPVIMFNEVAVLDGGPNPFTAVAVKDCQVWQISHADFQRLLDRIPAIGLSLLRVLAQRNRQMIDHYEDLSFRPVVARTAKLLLDLSGFGAHVIQRRTCPIEEMASRVATVPEAISRSLNYLKTAGAIRVSRSEIRVTAVEQLAAQAQVGPRMSD